MANLFPAPPVQTPFQDAGGISRGWMQWFQAIASAFMGRTNTAAAGSAGALPATVQGYLVIQINGTQYKVPYYL